MAGLVMFSAIFGLIFLSLIVQYKRSRDATMLHRSMSSKLKDLRDDCTMTHWKWKEWLPIFEACDDEVQRKCKFPPEKLSDQIRQIIGEGNQPLNK